MMAPFLEALGAALETVAEGAAEAEAVEAVEGLEDGIELPDDLENGFITRSCRMIRGKRFQKILERN